MNSCPPDQEFGALTKELASLDISLFGLGRFYTKLKRNRCGCNLFKVICHTVIVFVTDSLQFRFWKLKAMNTFGTE
jgi:hypothetical protein